MPRQIYLDGYIDAGVLVALALANDVKPSGTATLNTLAKILEFDASSLALLRKTHTKGFIALASQLTAILENLTRGDIDRAAALLNEMLAAHPAHPYLAKENGLWRLHHHPADAPLVPMYTAICSEALARTIGEGNAERFGRCEANGCERLFFDSTKNGTKRFCSTRCQSRTKVATFRHRARLE